MPEIRKLLKISKSKVRNDKYIATAQRNAKNEQLVPVMETSVPLEERGFGK